MKKPLPEAMVKFINNAVAFVESVAPTSATHTQRALVDGLMAALDMLADEYTHFELGNEERPRLSEATRGELN